MAEIRTEREGTPTLGSDVHAAENLGSGPVDQLPSGHALPGDLRHGTDPAAVVADDPEAVRSEIEQTRERMSSTINEIESALARKKEQLQEKLDVLSPVRERPLAATGIALGVGLALGLLTGGDDSDDDDRDHSARAYSPGMGYGGGGAGVESGSVMGVGTARYLHTDPDERAAMWESRARRLLRVAREQENKIRELQERYGTLYAREVELTGWEDDEEAAGELMSSVGNLRDTVLHGITGFLTDAFRQMGTSGSRTHG